MVKILRLHGEETWKLNKQEDKLQATEMDFCRKTRRKSRKDKTRNFKIRNIINIQTEIIEVIEEIKFKLFEHLVGKEEIEFQKLYWNGMEF